MTSSLRSKRKGTVMTKALAAALALLVAATAHAGLVGVAQRDSAVMLYSVTGVAGTTALDSGVLDTSRCSAVVVAIVNGNTTQTRTPAFAYRDRRARRSLRLPPARSRRATTGST